MWHAVAFFTAAVVVLAVAHTEDEGQCNMGPQAATGQKRGAMLQFSSGHTQVNSAVPNVSFSFSALNDLRKRSTGLGDTAHLTEQGYRAVSRACCLPDMHLFGRRVVEDLGLELCEEGSLAGTIKYHTCEMGMQSLAKLKEDIQAGMNGPCAWVSKPGSCREWVGDSAPLTEKGYANTGATCCTLDMALFTKRVVTDLGFEVCESGGLSGLVAYHTCEKGVQTFAKLVEDIRNGRSGKCAWVGTPSGCPPFDHESCGESPLDYVCKAGGDGGDADGEPPTDSTGDTNYPNGNMYGR